MLGYKRSRPPRPTAMLAGRRHAKGPARFNAGTGARPHRRTKPGRGAQAAVCPPEAYGLHALLAPRAAAQLGLDCCIAGLDPAVPLLPRVIQHVAAARRQAGRRGRVGGGGGSGGAGAAGVQRCWHAGGAVPRPFHVAAQHAGCRRAEAWRRRGRHPQPNKKMLQHSPTAQWRGCLCGPTYSMHPRPTRQTPAGSSRPPQTPQSCTPP